MFRHKHKTYYIGTARFNSQTKQENDTFVAAHHPHGCMYGFPLPMTEQIPMYSKVFVIEMLNLKHNRSSSCGYITGIGLVDNQVEHKKRNIYANKEYNRYIYGGKFLLKREHMNPQQLRIIKRLDWLLFHGKSHMKRSTWITLLPTDICERVPIKSLLIHLLETNLHIVME